MDTILRIAAMGLILAGSAGLCFPTAGGAEAPAASGAEARAGTAMTLFDFEGAGNERAWAALKETEWPEPAAKVELSGEHATSGRQSLKVTFDGGHLPAVTTGQVSPTDWSRMAAPGGLWRLEADVTLDRPCVIGLRVLQAKGLRFAEWSKQIPRWQTAAALPAGRHTIGEWLAPMLRAELGKVAAIDVFACDPPKGLVLHVDNIRLTVGGAATRPAGPRVRGDLGIYPQPAPPPLPRAGGTLTDPTFGTTILRVTDEADGDSMTAYSYWPTFNKDSTLFFINTGKGGPVLYRFDPKAFRITGKEPLFARDAAFPAGLGWEDAIWSGTDREVLFGRCGQRLASYNVRTKQYALLKDFSKDLPAEYPWQLSKSRDDNVFAFSTKQLKTYKETGYAVWRRDTDRLVLREHGADLDEVQVDKGGKFLVVKTSRQGRGERNVYVYDLATLKRQELTDDGPDYSPGHSDNGAGTCVGADNWRNAVTFRSLAAPHRHYEVLDTSCGHLSMLADDEGWVLMSNYYNKPPKAGEPWGTFAQEIFLVSTDGSQRVRRLCHHFSDVRGNYWHSPRANISRDGRFVAFTSNWGNPRHCDVFILQIPRP